MIVTNKIRRVVEEVAFQKAQDVASAVGVSKVNEKMGIFFTIRDSTIECLEKDLLKKAERQNVDEIVSNYFDQNNLNKLSSLGWSKNDFPRVISVATTFVIRKAFESVYAEMQATAIMAATKYKNSCKFCEKEFNSSSEELICPECQEALDTSIDRVFEHSLKG